MTTRGRSHFQHDRSPRYHNNSLNDTFESYEPRRNYNDRFSHGDSPRCPVEPCNKIFVTHFPPNFESNDLNDLFSKFGTITSTKLVRNGEKRYGFVAFSTTEEATNAISGTHQQPPHHYVVNYANNRYKDDANSTSNEEDNGNHSTQRRRTKSFTRYQNKENRNENNEGKPMETPCTFCGVDANNKCSSCGVKYCSTKCQDDDWGVHMTRCITKPLLVPDCSQDMTPGKGNFNKMNRAKLNASYSRFETVASPYAIYREKSVSELIREITAEYKKSVINLHKSYPYSFTNDESLKQRADDDYLQEDPFLSHKRPMRQKEMENKEQQKEAYKKLSIQEAPVKERTMEQSSKTPLNPHIKEQPSKTPVNPHINEQALKTNIPANPHINEQLPKTPSSPYINEQPPKTPSSPYINEQPPKTSTPISPQSNEQAPKTSTPVNPQINEQSPKTKTVAKIEPNMVGEAPKSMGKLQSLLLKLKKPKTPPVVLRPWEKTESLPENCFTQVSVVHVCEDSPVFYGTLVEKENISIRILTMANDGDLEKTPLTSVNVGSLCLVVVDEVIYRAIIQTVSPITARLLDFGYAVTVMKSQILEAPPSFAEDPAQGICMRIEHGSVDTISISMFDTLNVKPTGEIIDGATIVILQDEKYPVMDFKSLNNEVINEIRPDLQGTQADIDMNINPNAWKYSVVLPDVYTEVTITWIMDNEIFVSLIANEQLILDQLFYANEKKEKVPLKEIGVGQLCVVPYEDIYYRAIIRSVEPIRVFLLDYGNLLAMDKKHINCPVQSLYQTPAQAIHVRLAPGSRKFCSLRIDDHLMMRAVNKVGDVFIVQIEGDDIDPLTSSNAPAQKIDPRKKHALDYLYLERTGLLTIRERPCSNKFCLNLNIPEITSLYRQLTLSLQQSAEMNIIESPKTDDDVIVEHDGERVRAKVLTKNVEGIYVSLTDLGKVICVKEVFYRQNRKQYPHMTVLGNLLKIIGDKKGFESGLSAEDDIKFIVRPKQKDIHIIECKFANVIETSFILQLRPWKPTFEQLLHRKIFRPELSNCTVIMTHFEDQNSVYVRRSVGPEMKKYELDLQNTQCHAINARPLLTRPLINELVLSKYIDGAFYKATVKAIYDNNVVVQYTSFGNTKTVRLEELRDVSYRLRNVDIFVYKVALAEVCPDLPLTPLVIKLMNDIVNSTNPLHLEMKMDEAHKDHVYLQYPDGKPLNSEISKYLIPAWHELKDLSASAAQDKLLNQEVLMKSLIKEAPIPVGDNVKLSVIGTTNLAMNCFFACAPDQDAIAATMIYLPEKLKEYATTVNVPYNPRIDELCVALFKETDDELVWLRAYCASHDGKDCQLLAIDMGYMQYVKIEDIRRMTTDFVDLPALTAMFSIQGVIDAPLSPEHLGILKKHMIAGGSPIRFEKVKRESDGSYSVRLTKSIMDALLAA